MKRCPFCAEEIQDTAIVCRYCGRDLNALAAVPVPATPPIDWLRRLATEALVLAGCVLLVFLGVASQLDKPTGTSHAARVEYGGLLFDTAVLSVPIGFLLYLGVGFVRLVIWAIAYRVDASTKHGGLLVRGMPSEAGAALPTPNPATSSGRWLWWVLGGLTVVAIVAAATRDETSSARERADAEAIVEQLQTSGVLAGFAFCSSPSADFTLTDWIGWPRARRLQVMQALSRVCVDRGRPPHVELRNPQNGLVFARFTGTELQDQTASR